jgi:hypothetical protein
MQEEPTDIDILLSDAGDFIETKAVLWKLKTIESLADVSGELVAGLAMIVLASFVIILVSIGVALWVGEILGKSYYGFFIVGGFYGVIALIILVQRGRWLKDPFSNLLIRKILK